MHKYSAIWILQHTSYSCACGLIKEPFFFFSFIIQQRVSVYVNRQPNKKKKESEAFATDGRKCLLSDQIQIQCHTDSLIPRIS